MGRNIVLFVFVVFSFLSVSGQNTESKPLAPFDITLINNKNLRAFELKKNEPVMLMYFSPDCDHCKELTTEILKSAKTFGTKQLIMVTYFPISEVKKFANDLSIQNYPNIKVGTEGMTLVVQKHYNIRTFPFVVLYNKSGKLAKMFREQAPAKDIVKAMQQL
ncbi:thioredoxin domain-containing protein [Flavitalea sp.]|nr:thioredoxin domain-containing protein [Flavitalea sp.]